MKKNSKIPLKLGQNQLKLQKIAIKLGKISDSGPNLARKMALQRWVGSRPFGLHMVVLNIYEYPPGLDDDLKTFKHCFSFHFRQINLEIKFFATKIKNRLCLHLQGKTVSLILFLALKSFVPRGQRPKISKNYCALPHLENPKCLAILF